MRVEAKMTFVSACSLSLHSIGHIFLQLTYSMTRFAVYETVKKRIVADGGQFPFYQKVLLAGISGAMGGFVGTPADMVNVR